MNELPKPVLTARDLGNFFQSHGEDLYREYPRVLDSDFYDTLIGVEHEICGPLSLVRGTADIIGREMLESVDPTGKVIGGRLVEFSSRTGPLSDIFHSTSEPFNKLIHHWPMTEFFSHDATDLIPSLFSTLQVAGAVEYVDAGYRLSRMNKRVLAGWIMDQLSISTTSIETTLRLVSDDKLSNDYCQMRDTAILRLESAHRLFPFIRSQVTGEPYIPHYQEVEICDIFNAAKHLFKTKQEKVKGLEAVMKHFKGVRVKTDPGLLQIIVDNLFRNAYYHGGDEILVETNLQKTDGELKLQLIVSNNGVPIPEDELPKIWDRRVRGSNTKSKGSGLGTYFISRACELLRGDRKVISGYDGEHGLTTFYVCRLL